VNRQTKIYSQNSIFLGSDTEIQHYSQLLLLSNKFVSFVIKRINYKKKRAKILNVRKKCE
jgi:hypothetical protein